MIWAYFPPIPGTPHPLTVHPVSEQPLSADHILQKMKIDECKEENNAKSHNQDTFEEKTSIQVCKYASMQVYKSTLHPPKHQTPIKISRKVRC
jgi:hypothetical protein